MFIFISLTVTVLLSAQIKGGRYTWIQQKTVWCAFTDQTVNSNIFEKSLI